MSYALIMFLPVFGAGLCWFVAKLGPAPDDSLHVLTSDNMRAQVAKMPVSRYRYVRKDGIWHKQSAVSHGSLRFRVEQRVKPGRGRNQVAI